LLLITNRNVYTRFPLVPKSMTLSDPWPGFQGHGRQTQLTERSRITEKTTLKNITNIENEKKKL